MFTGFVHYIARTCSVSDDPFIDDLTVEKDECVDDIDYLHGVTSYLANVKGTFFAREGSICRCSGHLCNNKIAKEVETSKSKFWISIVVTLKSDLR